jgi:hypothetical protein
MKTAKKCVICVCDSRGLRAITQVPSREINILIYTVLIHIRILVLRVDPYVIAELLLNNIGQEVRKVSIFRICHA